MLKQDAQVNGVLVNYDDKECHGSAADRIALAVSDNPPKNPWTNGDRPHSAIMLCPWFIDCNISLSTPEQTI
jgi:hypothetical protein